MVLFLIILGGILSYFIGAFPTSVYYGLAYHNVDIRLNGSGNAGATNTFRVLGKEAGSMVMVIDIFKGFSACTLAGIIQALGYFPMDLLVKVQLLFGMVAVLGHIFPVYIGFKGGKGVATLLGMVLSVHFMAAILCAIIFLLVLQTTKYVSLGSILATLAFPLIIWFTRIPPYDPVLVIFGFVVFGLVVATHKKNIIRLFKGEENKTYLWKTK